MTDGELIAFAQRVLALLDGGRRVSTYKLAVLLSLIDCATLGRIGTDHVLPLKHLADRVVELYWPQVRPAPATGARLRQSEQPRAAAVDHVVALRDAAGRVGARTLGQTELMLPEAYKDCVTGVAQVLASQPLGKLQRPQGWRAGDAYPRPLYDDSPYPEKSASRRAVVAGALDVRVWPGVTEMLISLGGLLRPLLEMAWTRQVATLNRLDREEDDLHRFLFGAERAALDPVRSALAELQGGRCFYCGKRMPPGNSVHVDHFIPWSLVPEDGLANLVAADRSCNLDKSDLLAGTEHLERWVMRDADALSELASATRWPIRSRQTHQAAVARYRAVPDRVPLWVAPGRRQLSSRSLALRILGSN